MAVLDNFDSYTNGGLNAQGSWTADGSITVQSSVVQAGTKAISRAGGLGGTTTSTKSITAMTGDGNNISFYLRSTIVNNGGGGSFGGAILNSTNEIARVVISQDNNDIRLVGASTVTLMTGASVDTWYQCTIEIDNTNDRVRAKIDAGSFSAYVNGLSGAFSQVDVIGMIWGGTLGTCYVDTFENVTSQTLTMTAGIGSFALTGNSAGVGRLYTLIASLGSFILTGINAVFTVTGTHWTNQTKNSVTWTNQTKNSSTFTNQTKN